MSNKSKSKSICLYHDDFSSLEDVQVPVLKALVKIIKKIMECECNKDEKNHKNE